MKKIVMALVIVAVGASVSCADNIFDVLSSTVKAVVSGTQKTITNANPGKVLSDTVEDAGDTTQKAGEITVGAAKNTVGLVEQAVSNK